MAQSYYTDQIGGGIPEGGQEEEELLDFDRAMRDFQAMFPDIMASQIEHVLRKYDGDVSATINELLYDNTTSSTPTSSIPTSSNQREDMLTQLRRRRHEINEKLRDNQKLLDRVTDVESARAYEDQQLALLLEHREVSTLISEEKLKNHPAPVSPRKHVNMGKKVKKSEKSIPRRRSEEERVPDGPFIESEDRSDNFTTKIKETLRKASGSRFSRLFSAP